MRFATVGSNYIVDWFLSAGNTCPGFEHAAVYSRTMRRAREYAAHTGAKLVYDDLYKLCTDDSIDAVYIASPNAFHAAQAKIALEYKKHVLLEKPAAISHDEFTGLVELADKNSVFIMEAMRPAHSPGIARLKSLLPAIGNIRSANISMCKYSARYDNYLAGIIENAFNPTLGNGALMDIGVYCVSVMQLLFGIPRTISASAVFLDNGVDGAGVILAGYPGMTCTASYSKITQDELPSQIQGELGTLTFKNISNIRNITFIPRLNPQNQENFAVEYDMPDMAFEINNFIDFARGNTKASAAHTTRDTLAALEIMDAVRKQTGISFTL